MRPTILTAFLGYILVAVGLMYDLGRPWNIWHPLVMWNPHSPMFEVVVVRDALPHGPRPRVLGHGVRAARLARGRSSSSTRLTVPLVIAGAIISTLHQSSLGSFYLIMPAKLHAIWYTPYLPVMFYLSAICGGLAMMIVESRHLLARARARARDAAPAVDRQGALRGPRRLRRPRASSTSRAAGVLGQAFSSSREAFFFQLELAIGVILPMALLATPAVRRNSGRLYGAAVLVVAGFIMDRLNVSITGLEAVQGGRYVPSVAEGIITVMLVAIGVARLRPRRPLPPGHAPRRGARARRGRTPSGRRASSPPVALEG